MIEVVVLSLAFVLLLAWMYREMYREVVLKKRG